MASAVVFPDSLLPQEKSRGHAQEKMLFKSYEELPLTLSVPEMAAALGISRAGAYELARTEGFPALKIGTRIVIPKDKLKEWVDKNVGGK